MANVIRPDGTIETQQVIRPSGPIEQVSTTPPATPDVSDWLVRSRRRRRR